jgi:hypothetical protein
MGTVRTATLPTRVSQIGTPTITNLASGYWPIYLATDDATLILQDLNTRIGVSADYGTTVTEGSTVADSTWTLRGLLETADGELLLSVGKTGEQGVLYKTTGWDPATATWTSKTQVLVTPGISNNFRGYWGLNGWGIAPSWSRHAGAMFISEYTQHASQGVTLEDGAVHVWMSTDNGATWRVIFDLVTQRPEYTYLHVHSCCYDPWAGRVVVTQGDGSNAGTPVGHRGVWWSDDPEAATPTWHMLDWSDSIYDKEQMVTAAAIESGVILAPDGAPHCAKLIPRRGRDYGDPINLAGGQIVIATSVSRRGYALAPRPQAPILTCANQSTEDNYPTILGSLDGGRTWIDIYRHTAPTMSIAPGIIWVDGPDVNGKIVAAMKLASGNTYYTLVADYLPHTTLAAKDTNLIRSEVNSDILAARVPIPPFVMGDTFIRADGTVGDADSGQTWSTSAGSPAIASHYWVATTAANTISLVTATGAADGYHEVMLMDCPITGGATAYMIVRWVDSSHYLQVGISDADYRLREVNGSVTTLVSGVRTWAPGDRIGLLCNGSALTLFVNGVAIATGTSSVGTSSETIGLQTSNTTTKFGPIYSRLLVNGA